MGASVGLSRYQATIEHEHGRPWRDVVRWLVVEQRMSHQRAANHLRVSRETVSTWVGQMRDEGTLVPRRNGAAEPAEASVA